MIERDIEIEKERQREWERAIEGKREICNYEYWIKCVVKPKECKTGFKCYSEHMCVYLIF